MTTENQTSNQASVSELDPPKKKVQWRTLKEAHKRFEKGYIIEVLRYHSENIPATAKTLGMERTNLYRKLREFGIPVKRGAAVIADEAVPDR